jgi:hypothetical protein
LESAQTISRGESFANHLGPIRSNLIDSAPRQGAKRRFCEKNFKAPQKRKMNASAAKKSRGDDDKNHGAHHDLIFQNAQEALILSLFSQFHFSRARFAF